MRNILALAVLALPAALCADGEVGSAPADQGLLALCRSPYTVSDVCSASIYQVIADPRPFDGRPVEIVGFLAVDRFHLFLHPTRESYVSMDTRSSILLRGEHALLERIHGLKNMDYVRLRGVFRILPPSQELGVRVGVIDQDEIPATMGRGNLEDDPSSRILAERITSDED